MVSAFGIGCCSAAVALLLFGGKGKISDIMGDVAKGIKSFKKGMADDDVAEDKPAASTPPRSLENRAGSDGRCERNKQGQLTRLAREPVVRAGSAPVRFFSRFSFGRAAQCLISTSSKLLIFGIVAPW